ncbi:uncharacterized protein LOC110411504 [Herrania umbratica]|uniref:Uncharacterized protein LOC110411504 n=1 Tax=Herrania umbratica TaxID=108875 RepID=A0A6J0ZRW3_9ROSI|nr:uncharacterized protein LOC110411504 [Herrania umbratica]
MALLAEEVVSLPKSVQEMSVDGDEPTSHYIVKDSFIGSADDPSPSLCPFPILDISHFSSPSSSFPKTEVDKELEKLKSALSSSGCFQAIGHGISSSFLDKVRDVAKQFFALPETEKQKYARAVNESEGYGSDRIVSDKQVLDWSHRLTLRVFPEDKRRFNLWPENPNDFRDIMDEYASRIKVVTDVVFKAMARALNLEENSFLNQFGDRALMQARFNFYPSCSRPDLVLGVKPHTDRSGITVLLQDREVEGLQVLVDDKWVKVPVIPHALVINLGDQMQIMSNGIFESPMHRVVTNSEKLRISVALFNEPEPENEIGAVDGLVDENRPRTAVQTTTGHNSFACRTSSQAAKHPHCLTSNMAGMPLSSDGVSLSKSIQEMSMNGDEPPPEFYVKDSSFRCTDYSDLSASISVPVIDISLLPSSKDELEKLRQALCSGGCFQAVGHGISNSFIDKVREVAKQFFGFPQEEKQKYSRAVNEVEGYGHDLIVSEKQVLDWNSRLFLRVFPEHQRKLNLWPENPNNFREVLHEYSIKLKQMMDLLFQAMAKSLNLEEKSFSDQFGDNPVMQVRFNFYPPCSRPDKVLGIKPHSDRSGVTVLLQDEEVEGLQIVKDDRWSTVPVIPHALVVNLGDQMQIMSNGIFKSPMHRVVTNTDKLRISVAMFHEAEPDKEIGPVEGLIDDNRPRLYRNVKNYASFNYECFQKGKVALEEVKFHA